MLERLDHVIDALPPRLREPVLAVLLLCPAMLVLAVFGLAPMAFAAYLSLCSGRFGELEWAGWGNYWEALQDPRFWNSVKVTLYYAAGTVPTGLTLSFVVAYAISCIGRCRALFRTLYFLPFITSMVAAAMVWRALYQPRSGLLNVLLGAVGISPQQWLLEPRGVLHLLSGGVAPADIGPSLALCSIMLFDVWHSSGFAVVVFMAGLAAIPAEMEEAARIDGAGLFQRLRHVVLPLISPTLFFLLIVGLVRAFQAFNSFYALTRGGGNALGTTENLILLVYENFYEYGYWGYGAAIATLLSAAIALLTLLQWRFVGRRVFYG